MSLAAKLAQGVAQLGLALPRTDRQRLLDYVALLQKWNRTYSLTAVREPSKMLTQHLLDSLAVAPHVGASTILDVGSGAGLPGVPLAVALPHARVTLLDAAEKKAAFLRQVVIELGLANAAVVCDRVERWHGPQRFGLVISRALSDLPAFAALAGHLVAEGGELAAMKGGYPREELARLPAGFKVKEVVALAVPGVRGRRHLVRLARA